MERSHAAIDAEPLAALDLYLDKVTTDRIACNFVEGSKKLVKELLGKEPATELTPEIHILNLSLIRGGTSAILSRIPEKMPAVYAWYRSLPLPDPDDSGGEEFARAVLKSTLAPHCAPREGRIPPSHKFVLSSHQAISPKKQRAVIAHCESKEFRRMIKRVFDLALLFQSPLYVGKAVDLARRIQQHLEPRSALRERLGTAGIVLEQSRLLFLQLPASEIDAIPAIEVGDDDESDVDGILPLELVVEELLSRLFQPSFTLRFG